MSRHTRCLSCGGLDGEHTAGDCPAEGEDVICACGFEIDPVFDLCRDANCTEGE